MTNIKKAVILSSFLILVLTGCSLSDLLGQKGAKTLNPEEAKVKAEEFINKNLVSPGSQITINSIEEENGLYKLKVSFSNGQELDSYLTKDGKKFFTEAIDIEATENKSQQPDNTPTPAIVSNKTDKPSAELFVMSHCPYGTQVEKGILPVLDLFGNKIDFELKFVSYAMHDKKEIDEQLNQYCIQKEQPAKFISYLKCFLADSNGNRCLSETEIDNSKLTSCVDQTDKQFKITDNYNDKSTWIGQYPPFGIHDADNKKYGVSGSPALVVNGEKVSSGRDPQSLLQTICTAFNSMPDECNQSLSTTAPAPGFGFDSSGTGSGAECEG